MNVVQRRLLRGEAFLGRLREALLEHPSTIPVLVLRLPEFAELAWQDGRRVAQRLERETVRAFAAAADRVMRDGDILGHDDGSDWFTVAMLSSTRGGAAFSAIDVRAALDRISATMALETGRRMESGWWPVESIAEIDAFEATLAAALERGARERERYEFLATVGHELRTPLTSIRGYIETLLDGEVDVDTSRRFLETARREALRLARLVDGMLDFSMLDLQGTACRGITDVRAAIHSALDALGPIATEQAVTLSHGALNDARLRIDGDSCMHALLNVMENAIKYSGPCGVVEISVSRQDPFVCIHIDDNGCGVRPGDRERIFSYGQRAQAPEGVRGKGVGLSIVRTIVERAGGRVEVSDSHLGGARFTILLLPRRDLLLSLPGGRSLAFIPAHLRSSLRRSLRTSCWSVTAVSPASVVLRRAVAGVVRPTGRGVLCCAALSPAQPRRSSPCLLAHGSVVGTYRYPLSRSSSQGSRSSVASLGRSHAQCGLQARPTPAQRLRRAFPCLRVGFG